MVFQDPYRAYNPFYKIDRVLQVPIRKFRLVSTKVEVPPDNLRAAYSHVKTWDPSRPRAIRWQAWPWNQRERCGG